jgi:hypothetical protein
MALSDILTVPFLLSLGITLLLVGIVGFFFAQRLQEQNHKITSMFGLVTTMAEEMNFIRGRLQIMSYQGPIPQGEGSYKLDSTQNFGNLEEEGNLIHVSDGESEEDLEDDEDEDDNDDDEEEEDDDEDEEPEIIELSHDPNGEIKVINFAEMLQSNEESEENDNNSEELGDLDELDETEDLDDENDGDNSDNSDENQIKSSDLEFIKSIDISNLEESGEKNSVDYKKMSVNKLKEIAVSKGLLNDNSKATKTAILKLLGSE